MDYKIFFSKVDYSFISRFSTVKLMRSTAATPSVDPWPNLCPAEAMFYTSGTKQTRALLLPLNEKDLKYAALLQRVRVKRKKLGNQGNWAISPTTYRIEGKIFTAMIRLGEGGGSL